MNLPSHTLRRIVIANDGLSGLATALAKAARLEHYTGAELELRSVIWDSVAEEAQALTEADRALLIEALKGAERQGLRAIVDPIAPHVAQLESQVLWHRSAEEAILDTVRTHAADLLIKPAASRHGVSDLFRTPLDWQLMRGAPCGVLLSRDQPWPESGCILAAVDALDTRHALLTETVLETARMLAGALGLPLHIACAYPALGQATGALQAADDYAGIKADMRRMRATAIAHWQSVLKLPDAVVHIVEGRPATAIARLAEQQHAAVTVVGTSARTGLGKLVLGNTAEDLLAHLPGDVLSVRVPRAT